MRSPKAFWKLLFLAVCSAGCQAFAPNNVVYKSRGIAGPLRIEHARSRLSPAPGGLKISLPATSNDDEGPDPSTLIAAQDDQTQQLAFVAAFGVLAAGTAACISLWYGPAVDLVGAEYFEFIRSTMFPDAFGIIFAVVGVMHFVFVDNFKRIVPPYGTWGGLWKLPAPFAEELGIPYEDYHSYSSGVLEFFGGLWLLASGLGYTSTELPATLLFLLTIAVTPANLYMFTHDTNPGDNVPRLSYPWGHIARFALQCGLLSNFWIMAHPL